MFGNKKSDLAAGPNVPIDQVTAMKGQGYSNNQIIQSLQRDGYTSSQIFDAISQSEMAPGGDSVMPPQDMQQGMPGTGMQGMPPDMGMNQGMNMQGMPQDYGMQSIQPMSPVMGGMNGGSSTEEIIEAIIDEKWNELVKDINKIIDWKQKADNKLAVMEQKLNDMRDQFDKLHSALLGKIGEYDKHMLDVGAELQAMEKVFSKVLPSFMDNVNELSRITDKMKDPSNSSQPAQQLTAKSKFRQPRDEEE
jgi:hypothetical protein